MAFGVNYFNFGSVLTLFANGESTTIVNGCGGGKSATIEGHFIQSYHCSSNRLEVTEKHRVNSYSFVILASHVCSKQPKELGSLHDHILKLKMNNRRIFCDVTCLHLTMHCDPLTQQDNMF